VPWKETSPMEQRLAFVVEWLKHECSMAELAAASISVGKRATSWWRSFRRTAWMG
jgi:hypothetical protein